MAKILLENVRLSFPSLYEKESFQDSVPAYLATFLVEKGSDNAKKIKAEIERLKKTSGLKIPSDKICLKDGDDKEYDGYEGMHYIKATSKKRRPDTIDRDKTPLDSSDDKFYAGCHVNALIDLFTWDGKWGKGISANLLGVQFYADGEPFSVGETVDENDFEDLDGL